MAPGRDQHPIWQGHLEWVEKVETPTGTQEFTRHIPCSVSANSKDGEPELKADSWPQKLRMHFMPEQQLKNIARVCNVEDSLFAEVLFHPLTACEALKRLTEFMRTGFCGWVDFPSVPSPAPSDNKVLTICYIAAKSAYVGYTANDQAAFVDSVRRVIHQETTQASMRQEQRLQTKADVVGTAEQQPVTENDTCIAWDGFLEWSPPIDAEDSTSQKLRKVHCQILVNFIDGKLEIDTSLWGRTLNVEFVSKSDGENVWTDYTTVILDLGPYPAGEDWKSLQRTAATGMMPFTGVPSATDGTKTLFFEYSELNQTFVGHILNDQYSSQQCLPETAPGNSTQAGRPKPSIVEDKVIPSRNTVTMVRSSTGHGATAKDSPDCPRVQTPESLDERTKAEKRSSDEIAATKEANKRNSSEAKEPSQIPQSSLVGQLSKTTAKGAKTSRTSIQQTRNASTQVQGLVKEDDKRPEVAEKSPRDHNESQIQALNEKLEAARADRAHAQHVLQMTNRKINYLKKHLTAARKMANNYKRQEKRCDVDVDKVVVKFRRGSR